MKHNFFNSMKISLTGIVLVVVGIVFIVTFFISCMILNSSVRVFPLQADSCHIIPVYTVMESKDTIGCASTMVDSLNRIDIILLKERVKTLERLNGNLVDDIRQETNNNINILNGWLSFWIGLLALVGVFLPMALQYQLKREEEQRLNKLRIEIQTQMNVNRLQTLVYNISNGMDFQLLLDKPKAKDILKGLYQKSLEHFEMIVNLIINKANDEKRRINEDEASLLMVSILSMYKLYIILYQSCIKEERTVETMMDMLNKAMYDVNSYRKKSTPDLENSLKKIVNEMNSIELL